MEKKGIKLIKGKYSIELNKMINMGVLREMMGEGVGECQREEVVEIIKNVIRESKHERPSWQNACNPSIKIIFPSVKSSRVLIPRVREGSRVHWGCDREKGVSWMRVAWSGGTKA